MILNGVDYGKAFCSAGTLGFFGEGYWQYQFLKFIGLDFAGATFITKTITLFPQDDGLPLDKYYHPKEFFPQDLRTKFFRGSVLYPKKLSNPGSIFIISDDRLRKQTKPFFISYLIIGETPEERETEFSSFLSVLKIRIEDFSVPIGLELNINHKVSIIELRNILAEAKRLRIPVIPNFSVDTSIEFLLEVLMSKDCQAISISNSVAFGDPSIDWKKAWGKKPETGEWLLSGSSLLQVVEAKVRFLSKKIRKPIIAGGGVMCRDDAAMLMSAGAAAVKIGSVALLRPWRVRGIIKYLNS